ncbi:hypothetical protein DID76_04065 [Candidatus Marinamargulisbacteria bacterium SCGC AG-414-C22]|nr:hypothetical protein DID76_04065 [Candidatus Marinamargulisbacteria bacterium SCGC AG-414-C22]
MEGVMDLRKIVALAKRSRDETTDDTKRERVEEPINLALQGIVNSLGDYVLRGMVNKAAVGLTLWINKKEESPVANKIKASKLILNCYLAQLEEKENETATKLWLEGLELETLPAEIGNLTNLKDLYVNDNQLKSVEGVGKLTNLGYLNLINNQLTSIEGLEKLTNLTGLWLYDNQLTSVEGVEKLTNLRGLSLANNQLTSVEEVGKLTNLSVLYIGSNQLTSVEGVGKLTNLSALDIGSNQLTSVEGVGKLTNLTELSLANNQLTTLPDTFKQLRGLYHLNPSHNYLPQTESGELPEHIRDEGVGQQKDKKEWEIDIEETKKHVFLANCVKNLNNRSIGRPNIVTNPGRRQLRYLYDIKDRNGWVEPKASASTA